MSRIKGGLASRKRRKRLLKQTKGYWGQRKNVFKRAKETLLRALENAFIGRKKKKRDFRALFVSRINSACRINNTTYSCFINDLKKANVQLNRKMLSQLAVFEPKAFETIVKSVSK
ncbi:MAG: 50S ribosomal protein L20 [bacterium]